MFIAFKDSLPDKDNVFSLIESTGWQGIINCGKDKIYAGMQSSWYFLAAYDGDRLVGIGRIISDGVFQSFICDLIVLPEYQNKTIGSSLLKRLLKKCKAEGIVMVHLFSAQGKEAFYKKYGFEERPHDAPGMRWIDRNVV